MADGISIKIEGAKELTEKFKLLEPKIAKKILRKTFKSVGSLLVSAAQQNAPVGTTGQLKDSIKAKVSFRKNSISVSVGSAAGFYRGDVFYMAFNELGTSRQPAVPFLRPALEDRKDEIREQIAADIASGLEAN